ncbi:MAG: VWA domain-containing protein, partial [Desulfobacteraceae bacterium]
MKKHVINIGLMVILAFFIFISPGSGPLLAAPQKSSKTAIPAAKGPAATDTARMVLVLDASGSMWGQIEGKAKIEIAKKVMAELIDQIPADFQTGLTVYGHRRKGDC